MEFTTELFTHPTFQLKESLFSLILVAYRDNLGAVEPEAVFQYRRLYILCPFFVKSYPDV